MSLKGTLVFASGKCTDFDIWTLDLNSKDPVQLTSGENLNDQPKWSPDGSRIAFISTGKDFIASLWVMNRDGSDKLRLTTDIYCQHPSWSADGKRIVFTSNAENDDEFHVCVMDLQTKKHEILFRRDGHETEPSLSRDGSKVLFASTDPNSKVPFAHRDTEIWEYNLSTKLEKKICAHAARDYCPVYSPDSSRIAFVSHRNARTEEEYLKKLRKINEELKVKDRESIDRAIQELQQLELDGEIYVVDKNGDNLRQLTNNKSADTDVNWSPCGKYLVYSASTVGQPNNERIKILEVDTGDNITLRYNREALRKEINTDPNQYVNNHLFMYLIPNFLERTFNMRLIGEAFWGEERQPDWTAQ